LLEAARPRAGLAAPIGRDAHGPVWLDLVSQGPHALIAGTTGSGKSELLVAWVVALATLNPPSQLSFLLVDFKGGAAFAPLANLPHVVGILSDLDGRLASRAVESLRAELRRRERLLADRAARSLDELPPGVLARLVIVVDEFAVVVAEYPELQPVFADLAARGRSLGLHLVLCTQRPAGVIRDAVLANITLRISLRVTDRADSVAVVGTDAAAALPLEPPGRALIADGTGPRLVQLALAGSTEVAAVGAHPDPGSDAVRPWCDPLPERIPLALVPPDRRGYSFGLVDLPAEQRQPAAVYLPEAHGALLVLGATGAGKTTTLATLAARAGPRAFRLPAAPADAWYAISDLMAVPSRTESLLVLADDLDVLLGGFGADHRAEAIDLVARLAREGPSIGLELAAASQSMATMHALAGSFGSRLILRLASREEHVLAGGEGARFDPAAPPGAGSWRGTVVQVALADEQASPESGVGRAPEVPVVTFSPAAPTAIVSGRPRELRAGLLAAGVRLIDVGETGADVQDELRVASGSAPIVLLGDADAWQAEWALLGRARREWPIVLHAATLADHRALTRSRELPPPLGVRPGECWLVRDGVTVRATLRTIQASAAASSSEASP
jgi:S-DNA-T family DNA segregation ATPase FtsK/SpoIIIE